MVDVAKARALGSALVPFLVIPWTCSLLIYTGLSRWTLKPCSTPDTLPAFGTPKPETPLCAENSMSMYNSSKIASGHYKVSSGQFA